MKEKYKTYHMANMPSIVPIFDISSTDMLYLFSLLLIYFPPTWLLSLLVGIEAFFIISAIFFPVLFVLYVIVKLEFLKNPREAILKEMIYYYFVLQKEYHGR